MLSPRILILFLVSLVATSLVASAAWYNPFSWRKSKEEILEEQLRAPTPEEEAMAKFKFEEAMEHYNNGKRSKAHNQFEKLAKDYRRTLIAPEALLMKGQIEFEWNRFKDAFETGISVVRRYPDFEGFDRVLAMQFNVATALMEGRRGRMFGFIPKMKTPGKSRGYFETIIIQAPYSAYAPMCLMNVAMVSQNVNEQDYAIDALDRLINFYPNTMFGPEAYFMMGEIFSTLVDGPFYDQSATNKSISFYEDFLILFPDNPFAGQAEDGLAQMREVNAQSKYLLGEWFYKYRNNTTAALVFFNETITVAPNSESAQAARDRIERIRTGGRPPRYGLGITQFWKYIRGQREDVTRSAESIAREQEELQRAQELESEVLPAAPRPQG